MQGLDNAGVELKFSDVLGDLELGQLTEEYYKDPDLREILLNTPLDPDQMAPLEDHHLLLVTSVVYSTKFVLKGNRKHQVSLVQLACEHRRISGCHWFRRRHNRQPEIRLRLQAVVQSNSAHATPEEFKNAVLFLPLGVPCALFRHENGLFKPDEFENTVGLRPS